MSGSWWTRAMITLLAFLWSIWTLVPSFLDQSAMDRFNDQAAQAEAAASGQDAAAAAEVPWWFPYMSKARITFGLDLQGGIDLTLNVDVDEALASSVQRDIKPILDTAEKEGVRLAEVTRARGEPTLLILPGEGTTLVGIQDLLKKQYSGYEYVETRSLDGKDRFAFTVTSEQAAIVKKRAVEQARETLMNRIDETGVKEPSIVLRGESQINVQLPGIDNIEQATQAIGQAAVLEFMLVDEDVMRGANIGRIVQSAKDKAPPEAAADDDLLTEWLVGQGLIPATDRVLFEYVEQVVDG
jgi:preprotein translocase subunit SecD